jgi:methylamine utilization protein MauE
VVVAARTADLVRSDRMLATVAHALLGTTLLASALAKLAAPRRTRAALGTFGVRGERTRAALWVAVVLAEAGLGIVVALGSDVAAWAAAVLLLAFAAVLGAALRAGRAGRPCGCLGPRSRVGRAAVIRDIALAAAFALVPLVPHTDPSTDAWLAIGLVVALAAIAGLSILVFALAREVGQLRLALGPQLALEVEGEGPELGSRVALIDRFDPSATTRFALAVFSSAGCPMCQALAPAVQALARDPLLAVETFDEHADHDVWQALGIPGSPYALVLALDGTVLAQGTFNTIRQLESLVATAETRERERAVAHA